MKMFSVKTKIVVSDDCMDEFYDNDPKKCVMKLGELFGICMIQEVQVCL